MKVQVRLFSNLRKYGPDKAGTFQLELTGGTTVRGVLERLSVPFSVKRVVLVNGYHASEDQLLSDGDNVTFFPPMAGG